MNEIGAPVEGAFLVSAFGVQPISYSGAQSLYLASNGFTRCSYYSDNKAHTALYDNINYGNSWGEDPDTEWPPFGGNRLFTLGDENHIFAGNRSKSCSLGDRVDIRVGLWDRREGEPAAMLENPIVVLMGDDGNISVEENVENGVFVVTGSNCNGYLNDREGHVFFSSGEDTLISVGGTSARCNQVISTGDRAIIELSDEEGSVVFCSGESPDVGTWASLGILIYATTPGSYSLGKKGVLNITYHDGDTYQFIVLRSGDGEVPEEGAIIKVGENGQYEVIPFLAPPVRRTRPDLPDRPGHGARTAEPK